GKNEIKVDFLAGEQSLNRREDFLYTLLVPDRARTLFPCFDQPDIKAVYELSLDLPEGWVAMSNAPSASREADFIRFAPSDPLPTYLFSFVAGLFNEHTVKSGERSISIFHRETLPYRIAQCDTIGSQIFSSLNWLEDYTGIDYPFLKYDIAIIPGFQYGG
ncbi:MAG: aminopeptidase, partial [Bacteroidales bacterium]